MVVKTHLIEALQVSAMQQVCVRVLLYSTSGRWEEIPLSSLKKFQLPIALSVSLLLTFTHSLLLNIHTHLFNV